MIEGVLNKREIRQKLPFIKSNKDFEKLEAAGFPKPMNILGTQEFYLAKPIDEWLKGLHLKSNSHLIKKENGLNEYEGQRKDFKFTNSAKSKKT